MERFEVFLEDGDGKQLGTIVAEQKNGLLQQYRTVACIRDVWPNEKIGLRFCMALNISSLIRSILIQKSSSTCTSPTSRVVSQHGFISTKRLKVIHSISTIFFNLPYWKIVCTGSRTTRLVFSLPSISMNIST